MSKQPNSLKGKLRQAYLDIGRDATAQQIADKVGKQPWGYGPARIAPLGYAYCVIREMKRDGTAPTATPIPTVEPACFRCRWSGYSNTSSLECRRHAPAVYLRVYEAGCMIPEAVFPPADKVCGDFEVKP